MQLLRRYDQYRSYRTRSPGASLFWGLKILGQKNFFHHFSDMLVQNTSQYVVQIAHFFPLPILPWYQHGRVSGLSGKSWLNSPAVTHVTYVHADRRLAARLAKAVKQPTNQYKWRPKDSESIFFCHLLHGRRQRGGRGQLPSCALALPPSDEIWKLWSAPKAKAAHMSNKTVIWSIPYNKIISILILIWFCT